MIKLSHTFLIFAALLAAFRPDKNISESCKIEMVIQAGKISDREALKFDLRRDGGFRTSSPVSTTK